MSILPHETPIRRFREIQSNLEDFSNQATVEEETNNLHEVHCFSDLAIPDPFPSSHGHVAHKKKNKKNTHSHDHGPSHSNEAHNHEDTMYGEFNKYHPPCLIFIPNKNLLRKLMKLCTTVTSTTEIYYFM